MYIFIHLSIARSPHLFLVQARGAGSDAVASAQLTGGPLRAHREAAFDQGAPPYVLNRYSRIHVAQTQEYGLTQGSSPDYR